MVRVKRPMSVVVVFLLMVSISAVPTTVDAASPSISLTVNDRSVDGGEEVRVESAPRVRIEVTADAVIETVVVRVDGATEKTYSPGADSFSETLVPELEDGQNQLKVIVKDANGNVETVTITITKDDRGPFVRFTGPFETKGKRSPIPEAADVEDGYVTISGELFDASGVKRIKITRRFEYEFANDVRVAVETYRIRDPGSTFSQEVFLGSGTNRITIQLTDRMGHKRTYETELNVIDSTKPTIDVTLPEQTQAAKVTLEGSARDNVQLDSVKITGQQGSLSKTILTGLGPKPDESRVSVPLETRISLREGDNTITVEATDLAGNTVTESFNVFYERTIAPQIEFKNEGTEFTADGKISVSGVVKNGEITAVTVETIEESSGETVDLVPVYTGSDVKSSVVVTESLETAAGETRVVLRATDSNGEEHLKSCLVDPATETTCFDMESTPTPTPTTTTQDGTSDGSTPGGSDGSTPTQTATPPSTTGTSTKTDSGNGGGGGGGGNGGQGGDNDETSSQPQPGFEITTVLVAIIVAALFVLRRRR